MIARVYPGLGTRGQKKLILGTSALAENENRVSPHAPCQNPHRCLFSEATRKTTGALLGSLAD